jgi:hypothetical protein
LILKIWSAAKIAIAPVVKRVILTSLNEIALAGTSTLYLTPQRRVISLYHCPLTGFSELDKLFVRQGFTANHVV